MRGADIFPFTAGSEIHCRYGGHWLLRQAWDLATRTLMRAGKTNGEVEGTEELLSK